jgi:hypothetical protein
MLIRIRQDPEFHVRTHVRIQLWYFTGIGIQQGFLKIYS